MAADSQNHTGQSRLRVEDAALLSGAGQFIDDLAEPPGTLHAAILRSPHAHARIARIDTSKAEALAGVACVITGADLADISTPLVVGLKLPMKCWPMALNKARYAGEPVALAVASSRYVAEDALDLIDVDYEPLIAVVDPIDALDTELPVLHEDVGANLVNDRHFSYGDPGAAFGGAERKVEISVSYPRNAVTPMECYGVIARHDSHAGAYDVTANFQGPFSMHAVIARSLKVPGNRLRLRTPPDSGGSFGVKQGVFPYIVLTAIAARIAGKPVKWIEDRLEHLGASVSATNRQITLQAAVEADGKITALDWDQLEDVGAYIRAPEPATLYRMHGNLTGAYDIANVRIRNRIVVTNKTPTGLNRGFGGPQVYFALERLVAKIAREMNLDPLNVIRRNLVPADAFPYRTATGALYDSGDYGAALEATVSGGGYQDLLTKRDAARADGRLYGIGLAAVVEPSVSNMGYVSTVMTPEERAKAGPKNGAQATATVALDPLGGVTVHVASVPQGQGHRTVLGQVVGDVLGVGPDHVQVVTELDTARDAWTIASGNYASRFAAAVAGTAKLAAEKIRDKLAVIAAAQLNTRPDNVVFRDGKAAAAGNPENAIPFARLAATSHWAPDTVPDGAEHALRETVYWTPPELAAPDADDRVNSSLCHGFIFDFCGVEVERATGRVRIDHYVTMHDCGRILHPAMVDGQVRGGFANAVGAALYEEYAYGPDGSFMAGTFADYLVPTVHEIPAPEIMHYETPSPFTPLGAKGVGEGNCMSTPAALANAVSDALDIEVTTLPMTPARMRTMIDAVEPLPPEGLAETPFPDGGREMQGAGEETFAMTRQRLWETLLNPETLRAIVPGCHGVERVTPTHFRAEVTLGIGPVKGRYVVEVLLSELEAPQSVSLSATATGTLGSGNGSGHVHLFETPEGGTRLAYDYRANVGGKVASVGGRLLDGAARVIIGQFFKALGQQADGAVAKGFWARLMTTLFGRHP